MDPIALLFKSLGIAPKVWSAVKDWNAKASARIGSSFEYCRRLDERQILPSLGERELWS